MPATSRYLRSAVRTRTVTGTTSVGGTTSTVISIMPDGTIRFVDRNGRTQDIQAPANYTTAFQNRIQPNTRFAQNDPYHALYAFVDALIARA